MMNRARSGLRRDPTTREWSRPPLLLKLTTSGIDHGVNGLAKGKATAGRERSCEKVLVEVQQLLWFGHIPSTYIFVLNDEKIEIEV